MVCIFHDLTYILNPGHYGAKLKKLTAGYFGQQSGQRGFAGSRRAVKDERGNAISRNTTSQESAFLQQMFLADDFFNRGWSHSVCQRCLFFTFLLISKIQ